MLFFFSRKNGSQVHEKSRGVHRSGGKLTWPYILGSFGPLNVVANQPTPPHPPEPKIIRSHENSLGFPEGRL